MSTAATRPKSSRGRAAQATVEFAFVAPLFFLALFTSIEAALWTIETSAAVSVADESARFAASAANIPKAGPATSLALQVYQQVQTRLQGAMFGTKVVEASPCPALSAIPAATVDICVDVVPNDRINALPTSPCPCPPGGTYLLKVEVIGHLASLLPSGFFFGQGIPVDVGAVTHPLTFAQ